MVKASGLRRSSVWRLLALGLSAALAAGCGDGEQSQAPAPDAGGCLPTLSRDCQKAFPPEYAAIFDNVLSPTCGSSATGSSCHGPDGEQGGLALHDRDGAYDSLLGISDGRARVIAGDPECSILVHRLESNVSSERMPPGPSPLAESERCAIVEWIDQGATREP